MVKRLLFLAILLVAGPAQAGVVFDDQFTDSNGTSLQTHTPTDTGTGWTETSENCGGDNFEIQSNTAKSDTGYSSDGCHDFYLADDDPTEADVDIEADMSNLDASTDDVAFIVARYQDSNNYIGLVMTNNSTTKAELFKIVSGSATSLGTSTNTPQDGDIIKLELRGSAWKVYFDGGSGYGSAEISVTETDLSSAGSTGIGCGDLFFSSGDCTLGFAFDRYTVTEFASGGASFIPKISIF